MAMAIRQPLNFSATVVSSLSKELSNSCGPIRLGETRAKVGILSAGFCDRCHVQYYNSVLGMRMSGKEVKSGKEKPLKKKMKKKRQLKLLKGLSRDLSTFSLMGYGLDSDGALLDQIRGNMITEATQVLLEQIQRLKAEEKESKRQMKEEKARAKAAARMLKMSSSSSSSSSCSSGESECEEVVYMKQTKPKSGSETPAYPAPIIPTNSSVEIVGAGAVELQPSNVDNGDDLGEISKVENADDIGEMRSKKIEVCMGGKCKKSGGGVLLEELKKAVGIQSVVSGCKCMGKCRDGPNLKLVNPSQDKNSVCVGVGLEDVDDIVSTFLGDQHLG